jgi:hypothetical protein
MDSISGGQLRLNQYYVEALGFLSENTDRKGSHNLSCEKNKNFELHSGSQEGFVL